MCNRRFISMSALDPSRLRLYDDQRFGRKESSTLIPRSETDLLTSSIRSHGISSLASQSISGYLPPVHGERGRRMGCQNVSQLTLPTKF
jgi:hypothetical protein